MPKGVDRILYIFIPPVLLCVCIVIFGTPDCVAFRVHIGFFPIENRDKLNDQKCRRSITHFNRLKKNPVILPICPRLTITVISLIFLRLTKTEVSPIFHRLTNTDISLIFHRLTMKAC